MAQMRGGVATASVISAVGLSNPSRACKQADINGDECQVASDKIIR